MNYLSGLNKLSLYFIMALDICMEPNDVEKWLGPFFSKFSVLFRAFVPINRVILLIYHSYNRHKTSSTRIRKAPSRSNPQTENSIFCGYLITCSLWAAENFSLSLFLSESVALYQNLCFVNSSYRLLLGPNIYFFVFTAINNCFFWSLVVFLLSPFLYGGDFNNDANVYQIILKIKIVLCRI